MKRSTWYIPPIEESTDTARIPRTSPEKAFRQMLVY
jgi:hypothetical protein